MKEVDALIAAVLGSKATLPAAARKALLEGKKGPAGLSAYAARVRNASWKVGDQDLAALKKAGFDEDAIFEATVTTALGEGLARLNKGESLLNGGKK